MGAYQRCGECGHYVDDEGATRAYYREEMKTVTPERALMRIGEDLDDLNKRHGFKLTLVWVP